MPVLAGKVGLSEPGEILLDLAGTVALGGDCPADIGVVRAQEELFGPVGSDPTVSRLIDRLVVDAVTALAAIRAARAAARAAAWAHRCPVLTDGLVPVDIDRSVLIAHSEKQSAAPRDVRISPSPTPAAVPVGRGTAGGLLRPGSANANTAADHITVLTLALTQLPEQVRPRVLVRADSGGGTKAFLTHVFQLGWSSPSGSG